MQFSLRNLNECRDRATQVEQGVHLDGSLLGSKPGPREHRQAEVDGGGVQGIHGVVEIETERLIGVHGARDVNENLSEVGEDAPVMRLVGVGDRGARDPAAEAHVIKLALHGAQASFDVAEALAKGQLRKSQTKELIQARKSTEFVIAAVALHALVELVKRKVIDQLGEDGAADKHAPLSAWKAERRGGV